jgi:hypothetical protein
MKWTRRVGCMGWGYRNTYRFVCDKHKKKTCKTYGTDGRIILKWKTDVKDTG